MRIVLLKPVNTKENVSEMLVKIGNNPSRMFSRVTGHVFELVNRFKRIEISLTPIKGFTKWGFYNWGTGSSQFYICSPKGREYYFCKKGFWRAGGKMPKQTHVWVKCGE